MIKLANFVGLIVFGAFILLLNCLELFVRGAKRC